MGMCGHCVSRVASRPHLTMRPTSLTLGESNPTLERGFASQRPQKTRFRAFLDLERAMGIEPTLVAWEATVLPLNYAREGSNYKVSSFVIAA